MKKITVVFLCMLVIFLLASCKKEQHENDVSKNETESVSDFTYMAEEQGIAIMSACRMAAADNKETLGIVVLNNSDKTLQYAEIIGLFSDGTIYKYQVSTLPPDEMCYVEEVAASPYRQLSDGFTGFEISSVAFFQKEPSVCSDILQFSSNDGILNVKNISDTDITDNIVVYYKDYKDNCFTSGKTYRTTFKDGLSSGEIKQQTAKNFRQGESIVMFVQFVSEVE